MQPLSFCRQIVRKSQSNFAFCLLFLQKEQRKALIALYAFCREMDDIADASANKAIAKTKLISWQKEIAHLYQGAPQHTISLALSPFIQRYELPKILLEEIIAGMLMDIDHSPYETFEALSEYCYRVAGVVGLLLCRIFGYQDPDTLRYAEKLGLSLQLINIIRDVGEDAKRNRVYLPEDILLKYNLTPQDILQKTYSQNSLKLALTETADIATKLFQEALSILPERDRDKQIPGLIIGTIYFELLNKIKQNDFNTIEQKIQLSKSKKLWIAFQVSRHEKVRAKRALAIS